MKSTALVFRSAGESELETVNLPDPGPTDAVVRITYSGVSIGTELSIITGARTHNGTFPLISGYMAVGTVEHVGAKVANIKPGDTVVSSSTRVKDGINPVFGGHAAHHVCEGKALQKVPEGCDLRAAAMHVMPAVGLNAVNMAGINDQDTIVVSGQGLIGQFFAQWAAARGARVIAIEPDPLRARVSVKEAGVEIVNPAEEDVARKVEELTGGEWPTVVVEATANPNLIIQSTSLLRRMHARMIFLSWYPQDISLAFAHFHSYEATAYFPMGAGDGNTKRAVLRGFARNVIRLGDNLTDIVAFEDSPQAMRRVIEGDRNILGMIFDWRACS